MKGGYSHNFNHFTGKKKGIKTVMRKKKVKQRKTHNDKYANQHDNIVYVEENNRDKPAATYIAEEKESGHEVQDTQSEQIISSLTCDTQTEPQEEQLVVGEPEQEVDEKETETNTSFSCPEFLHPDILREVIKNKFSLYHDCSDEDVQIIAHLLCMIDTETGVVDTNEPLASIMRILVAPNDPTLLEAINTIDKIAYNIYWESVFLSETSAYTPVMEWISLTIKKGLGLLGEKTKEIPFPSYEKDKLRKEKLAEDAAKEKENNSNKREHKHAFEYDITDTFWDIAIPDIIGKKPELLDRIDALRFVVGIIEAEHQEGSVNQLKRLIEAAKVIYDHDDDLDYIVTMDRIGYLMYIYSEALYLTEGEKQSLIYLSLIIKSIVIYMLAKPSTETIPVTDAERKKIYRSLLCDDTFPFRPYFMP